LEPAVIESDRDPSIDRLQRGTADVALIDEWPEMRVEFPSGIAVAELGEDVADLLVPAGHPLALADGPVRLADAAGERWIAALPGTVCYEWLLRILPGLRPSVLIAEFETQLTFVAAGLGIAFMPRLARTSVPPGVVVRPIEPVTARRVLVAWRRAAATRPAIGAVVDALRDAWSRLR
jgi:DNA-binding transcriptional LysR family regulator